MTSSILQNSVFVRQDGKNHEDESMGNDWRFFPGWGERAAEVGKHLLDWFDTEQYECQLLEMKEPSAGYVLQVRESHDKKWQENVAALTGLDVAATVELIGDGNLLKVRLGTSKWMEKAVVAGAGYFVFPVLLVTAGIGFYRQKRLLDEIDRVLTRYVATQEAR